MRFINEHKQRNDGGLRWGVESICAVLSEHGTPIAWMNCPWQRGSNENTVSIALAR